MYLIHCRVGYSGLVAAACNNDCRATATCSFMLLSNTCKTRSLLVCITNVGLSGKRRKVVVKLWCVYTDSDQNRDRDRKNGYRTQWKSVMVSISEHLHTILYKPFFSVPVAVLDSVYTP